MNRKKLLTIGAFFAIYVIWGSTYLWTKVVVAEIPPLYMACVRFIVAGLIILGFAWILKRNIFITRKQFFNTGIAGILYLTIGNGAMATGLQYIDSGVAALLVTTQPLVILLLLYFIDGKKIQVSSIIGVILGFIGIALLVSQHSITTGENAILGISLFVVAVCSWSFGSLFVGRVDLPDGYFVSTAYQMLISGILLGLFSYIKGEEVVPITQWSVPTLVSMSMLIFLGSIVAFTSFNYLLQNISPEKVATSTYVNPIVALLLGWYFLNETITLQSIVAAIILLTGVYFVNTKRKIEVFRRFRRQLEMPEE